MTTTAERLRELRAARLLSSREAPAKEPEPAPKPAPKPKRPRKAKSDD